MNNKGVVKYMNVINKTVTNKESLNFFPNSETDNKFLKKLEELGNKYNLNKLIITPDYDNDFLNLFIFEVSDSFESDEIIKLSHIIVKDMKEFTKENKMEYMMKNNAIFVDWMW